MIHGIISAVLFIIICLRAVEKAFFKRNRIFTKIHSHASIAFVIILIVHIIFAFPLLKARPIFVFITGIIGLIFICLSIISGIGRKIKMHRVFVLCALILIALHIVFNLTGVVHYQNQVKNIVIENIDIFKIPDGVYTGECNVTFIYAKVEVTVKSGEIADIAILEHRNERGKPAESVINDILDKQKIDVDAVSNASNSSMVIKKAIENALSDD